MTAKRRRGTLRDDSCKLAFDADPANTAAQGRVWRATCPTSSKTEAIAMLREAAAQGSAEAYHQLYEHHRSWDRGDLDQRAAGHARRGRPGPAQGRRTRASLCHADAGTPARGWGHRQTRYSSPRDTGRNVPSPTLRRTRAKADLQVTLGRLLATSDKPDERARGLDILERMSDARTLPIRRQDANWRWRSARRTRCAPARCSKNPAAPIPAAPSSRSRKC